MMRGHGGCSNSNSFTRSDARDPHLAAILIRPEDAEPPGAIRSTGWRDRSHPAASSAAAGASRSASPAATSASIGTSGSAPASPSRSRSHRSAARSCRPTGSLRRSSGVSGDLDDTPFAGGQFISHDSRLRFATGITRPPTLSKASALPESAAKRTWHQGRRSSQLDPEQTLAQGTMNDSSAPISVTGVPRTTARKRTKHLGA